MRGRFLPCEEVSERKGAEGWRRIVSRQARVMPDRVGRAESWQADRGGAGERAEVGGGSVFVEIDAGGSGRADFEEQRLLEHQRAVAGEGRRVVGAAGVHFGTPAGGVERGHASTSFSAAAKAAISSSVPVSVTATISPFARPALSG